MDVCDIVYKPKTGSVQRKKPEKEAEALLKKEFFLIYSAFSAFANACEKTWPRVSYAKTLMLPAGERKARLTPHIDRAIVSAESYSERDQLYRRLASHCYQTAHWFEKKDDFKQAAKWMNLALRFLKLSLDPKVKGDLESIKKELTEIKAMQEREEKEEEDDGEN